MPNFQELIDAYVNGSTIVRTNVAGLSREQLLARPIAGKWSTLECVAHLADFEPVHADRMKRIIALDRPLLLDADERLFSAELGYQNRDIEEELAVIEGTRLQLGRLLKTLAPDTANRVGIHSYRGLMTLEAVLQNAVNHLPHHAKFIEEKRRALSIR